ncbi:MAG: hypothetical protein ACREUV_06100 [Burkholderiales bacterium]
MWNKCLVVCALLAARAACADPAFTNFAVSNPRPFGYVIGDTLERTLSFEVAKPYALENEKLPKTGRTNTWLELRSLTVNKKNYSRSTYYELSAVYQLTNSPEEIKTLALPPITLHFAGENKTIQQKAPEFLFSAAPITPAEILTREGLDVLRPDKAPAPVAYFAHAVALAFFLAAALSAVLIAAYLHFGLPWQRARPFARAYREVRKLTRKARGEAQLRAAFRQVHRAFDETAGKALFAEQLGAFFSAHPRFGALQNATQNFFALSQREFFGNESGARELDWLLTFCRDWRNQERAR